MNAAVYDNLLSVFAAQNYEVVVKGEAEDEPASCITTHPRF